MLSLLSRTVDKVAEEMAHDLLRDPEIRDQLQTLVKEAFATALAELRAEKSAKDDPLLPGLGRP